MIVEAVERRAGATKETAVEAEQDHRGHHVQCGPGGRGLASRLAGVILLI